METDKNMESYQRHRDKPLMTLRERGTQREKGLFSSSPHPCKLFIIPIFQIRDGRDTDFWLPPSPSGKEPSGIRLSFLQTEKWTLTKAALWQGDADFPPPQKTGKRRTKNRIQNVND